MEGTTQSSEHPQMGSISKAVAILDTVSASPAGLSVRELAVILGFPRSTIYDICRTLTAQSLLRAVPSQGYQAGPRLLELGSGFIDRTGLLPASQQILDKMPVLPGMELRLSQLVGGWVYYLAHRGFPTLSSPHWRTFRVPAALVGCGIAALSLLTREEIAHYPPKDTHFLPNHVGSEGLQKQIDDAMQDGVCVIEDSDFRTCVAAPIATFEGAPIGAISIYGPTNIFSGAITLQCSKIVRAAASRIEVSLLRLSGE